jgi:hypothetical protein
MATTLGQWNYMVNGQIGGAVARHSPPLAPFTMASSVLTQYLLSYYSVPAGVAPAMCTATLPIALCLVLSITGITA